MFRHNYLISLFFFLFALSGFGQEDFPVNGVKENPYQKYFLINGIIHQNADRILENADMLIQDGKIMAVGTSLTKPKDAIVIDLKGDHHVYTGFIDLFSDYGMPKVEKSNAGQKPQFLSDKAGAYGWNEAIKSEFRSSERFAVDEGARKNLLNYGISMVLSQRKDGLSRGSASLIQLTKKPHDALVASDCAHAMSFKKGSSSQDYPSSLMGAIALLNQTHYDAVWNKKNGDNNISLTKWSEFGEHPIIFETGNKWEVMNALDIAETMSSDIIVVGSNDEYQRVDELKNKGVKLILPLKYPKAIKIESEFDLSRSQYADMKHWELAPYNARMLYEKGLPFSLTANGLKDAKSFMAQLRKLVKNGLPKSEVLRALTQRPADWLDVSKNYGSLENGKMANFFIANGDIFESGTAIKIHFIEGAPNHSNTNLIGLKAGKYEVEIGEQNAQLILTESKGQWSWKSESDSSFQASIKINRNQLFFKTSWPDTVVASEYWGYFDEESKSISGITYSAKKESIAWKAKFIEETNKKPADKNEVKEKEFEPLEQIIYPFQAYGTSNKTFKSRNVLFENATVWTNEEEGVIKADVWIKDGKIQKIGENLKVDGAETINAEGKHLTSGIIDEHSHIAIRRGVNEGTKSSSAEVSIADVINPDDVNIYRHLAGGVTAVQQLHGSANPIGGQSSLIKLRWGQDAESMKIDNADGFIKFALGENVKQTNWGDQQTIRFPQTRMGVEQVFVDYFTRARAYDKKKKSGEAYRKDIGLEAISEILNKKRFITCHSYQQGEINMLMKVAESFDIRVNTFTHILEGYKVADKMKEHGVGASTFSDWWGYKYEVIDAIPYNAAILQRMGVVTAINSDDAEMGRRLNQEAAKVMKYGNVSEEEAWKMVTLNPAKLLHLDDRMGSIKKGKDADIVLWSDHPLSSYAQVEKTFIDGVLYFDSETLEEADMKILEEKRRIAEKMKKDPNKKEAIKKKEEKHYHCDDMEDELK